ncbi:hypothetical protein CTAYLR_002550 [Chrysophaeum taylorii]|uniref:Prefoldin subunit 4 n=1 Tax=Chrysophaeum taylorii TaxID=2483200 RepID=A0AAD7XPZ1_9STRA|nr:hypothetical protein CTAYLR_002550 [Chrysophaeum taylorii]
MIEEMEDATTELAMGDGQNVKLMLGGEAFLEVDEDYANEYCETMQEKLQADMEEHNAAIGKIETRQKVLKADLYARFGTSINLEEK